MDPDILMGDKTKSDVYHMIADDSTIKLTDEVILDKEVRNLTVLGWPNHQARIH